MKKVLFYLINVIGIIGCVFIFIFLKPFDLNFEMFLDVKYNELSAWLALLRDVLRITSIMFPLFICNIGYSLLKYYKSNDKCRITGIILMIISIVLAIVIPLMLIYTSKSNNKLWLYIGLAVILVTAGVFYLISFCDDEEDFGLLTIFTYFNGPFVVICIVFLILVIFIAIMLALSALMWYIIYWMFKIMYYILKELSRYVYYKK